jgi:CheY-like chemotaxis protein
MVTHVLTPEKRRIVLVEDNPADVLLFRWALAEYGLDDEVEVVDHGDAAMEFARRERRRTSEPWPRVVLLDLKLPGHDGLEVLQAIRDNPAFRRTVVGIFSSSDDPRDRQHAMRVGAQFYIQKPADLQGVQTLADTIGWCLATGGPAPKRI